MKKIVFTGGGSAGHVVPNIAVMQALKGKYKLYYVGSTGIESRLLSETKVPFYSIDCPKLIRGFSMENCAVPFRLFSAVKQAEHFLKEISPDLVFSKGGYVALPVVLAARKLKIPCITHESDFSLGLANKLMANKCQYVLTSFFETARTLKNGRYTGSPMRQELFSKRHANEREQKPTLLVLGGGSGSKCLNDAVRKNLPALLKKYDLLHVCGKGNVIDVKKEGYTQIEYASNMGELYANADGVLCRAGSNTVFEVLALKKPTLFVPLQNKRSRGDQVKNAEYFHRKGLCRVLYERDVDHLVSSVDGLFADEDLKKTLQACNVQNGVQNVVRYIHTTIG